MRLRDITTLLGTLGEKVATMPMFPGPYDPQVPHEHILIAGYGGPGEDADGLLDQTSWQIRVIGPQNDYETAEDVALTIDRAFLSLHSAHLYPGGPWVVGCSRVGGAPSPLLRDDADRWHFICSYIFSHQMALVD